VRAALDGRDAVDWYATFPGWAHYPPLTTIDGATDYVVLVQETADRFARATTFAHQSEPVRAYARAYDELLARPAILLESTAGSFSYRNVPLRIVALGSNAARLAPCSASSGRCRGRGSRSFRVVTTPRKRATPSLRRRPFGRCCRESRRVRAFRRQCHSRTSTKCPAIAAAAAIAGDTRWVRPL
jgi:hypothetical protein